MMSRKFEISPQPKMALQLSLVLWLAVLSFIAPLTILTGQVQYFGEYLSLFTGTFTALFFAWFLFVCFRALAGKPLAVAGLLLCLAVAAAALGQTAADYGGQFLLHAGFQTVLPETDWRSVGRTALVYWCLFNCNAALFWLTFVDARARQEKTLRSEAELSMLRLQLNPHFMINSLNRISGLVASGRNQDAEQMTDKLSEFLRASLQISGEPLVPLRDELFLVESYLGIEESRFEDRISYSIDCPDDLDDVMVPNFILQPLVENAMKHSLATSSKRLKIYISAQRSSTGLVLEVCNESENRTPLPKQKGMGIGLRNIIRRLELLYGSDARLEAMPTEGGFGVTIKIPLMKSRPDQADLLSV
jgi:two-component system LytT family sensor kinase